MRFYDTTFFCDGGGKIEARGSYDPHSNWKVTLTLAKSTQPADSPNITIFFSTIEQLTNFHYSLYRALEHIRKEAAQCTPSGSDGKE